jgi:NADPH-dependent 2,4-dienoyl-CoA reductase/sulfur reductase-like enzyme
MKLVIIGGSDAGIAAGLRARELDQAANVIVLVADRFPNFSICGLPYWLAGEVADWEALAYTPPFGMPWDALQVGAQAWLAAQHRTRAGLETASSHEHALP